MERLIHYRRAERADVSDIVALLADDPLGAEREQFEAPLPESYFEAFSAIDEDPNNELLVAVQNDRIIGVLQLTFIPYLTYQGGWRALIEGVRVARSLRSKGIGREIVGWALERARERGCHMVQLTTDKKRPEALEFYESLGFNASHDGMKLHLDIKPHKSVSPTPGEAR